ncbi:hypothetical protein Tco_0149919 [Tanacetum coccineum]
MTGVTTTIPRKQTGNSTYEVVRFNLDDADGNVRKVYDKHVGILEEYYDHGDPTFECKECHALVWEAEAKKETLIQKTKVIVYVVARDYNSSSSSAPPKSKHPIDRDIIRQVKDVLDTLSTDEQTYNLSTGNEVAVLIIGDFDTCVEQRDIMIEKHLEGLERINIFHPLYLPLQYPLLMPRGQDGYHLKIPHRKKPGQTATGKKDKMVSIQE